MIQSLTDAVVLNNGVKIYGLGLGVFQIPNEKTIEVVKNAIISGYRSIDTAQIYGNEVGTGLGIKEGLKSTGLSREDLFITSKVWNNHLSFSETLEAFDKSLELLGLDYLDLYLIHWPGNNSFDESWKALEELYLQGKIRAIGVSNFQIHHLKHLLSYAKITPVINQVELHPRLSQHELREFSARHNIKIQAWSPLAQGTLLNEPLIVNIAKKYRKSPAQIILRWDIQQGILFNVRSVKKERMISNSQIFDFELAEEDMKILNGLNDDHRVGPNPDSFDFE